MLEEHRYTKNLERLESERDEALEDAQAWRRLALDARKAIEDAPHGIKCSVSDWVDSELSDVAKQLCNCWKRDALEVKE